MASGTQHATEQLDQVIVRFAGDSGDGMQLTGDRFTDEQRAAGQRHVDLPRLPGRDPGTGRHASTGCRRSRSISRTTTSSRPGDSPNVLVAMNPAALKANIDMMAKGTVLIVNSDAFEERDLAKAGYAVEPADRRLPRRLHGLRGADDLHHPGGLQGGRRQAPRRRALQELLRAGPDQLALHPADRPDDRVDRRALRRQAPGGRGQHAGLPGRLRLRRDGRALRVQLRGAAGHLRAGRVRPGHGEPGAGVGPDRRVPPGRACPCSSGATRSPRPRTSSTS